jgi:PcaR/PcaU/PobR family beta-ketoadipate pathway transcriptional regulator
LSKASPYTIEALQRGLHVLSLFNRETPALSLTDIVDAAVMNKSTAFRVVSTLESAGYLERDPGTKQYRPGLKVLQLGFTAISSLEFRQIARPYLSRLSRETGETASMGVLDDLEVVYVDRVRTQRTIVGVVLGLGSRIPAHCASMGKVLLASLTKEELHQRLHAVELIPCTTNTFVDLDQIEDELDKVRNQGYAANQEELEIGLRAIAAPIWNYNGQVVAAINVSGSVRTISDERLNIELVSQVTDTADQISQSLGYGGAE